MEPIITRHIGTPDLWRLETYQAHGGYETLARALRERQPDDLVAMVRDSGLRGRGGAGFPTGVKWGFLPKDGRPRYLICNGDESEPGTFKDRLLLENDPHQVLEGLILSCYAVGAHLAFHLPAGRILPRRPTCPGCHRRGVRGGLPRAATFSAPT